MKTRLTLSVLLIALLAWPALASPPLERPSPASHDAIALVGRSQAPSDIMQPVYAERSILSDVFLDGADRLESLQNADGGWGWPLTGGSALNTIGPIGKGLARAQLHTLDAGHLAALGQVGAFLLAKTNNFSASDGYLAAQLDAILGGTAYVSHVNTYFYGPLEEGTYDRLGLGILYDTAEFVQRIRDNRTGSQANLAAWDIGMGLVGALAAGADLTAWIAGVEAEIDELDGDAYYDVIGLAGALYGLAAVGVAFDPTAGEHAAASSLADLAAILAGYQIAGGGFTWTSLQMAPGNETNQETAYSILALNAANRTTYLDNIVGAGVYLMSVQLGTGGWDNYVGDPDGENNEITGEALWGIDAASSVITEVWVDATFTSATPGWGITHFASIKDGIDAVTGSTVHVAAGTYVESAQLYIDEDLILIGAGIGTTVVMPGFNTTVGGNVPSEAFIYVAPGFTATIEGITVDGTGFTVNHAIQSRGASLTVRDCEILDISAGAYAGRGIVYYTGTGLVEDCVMSNIGRIGVHARGGVVSPAPTVTVDGLTYTGKGAGDYLDYGIEFGGGGGGAVMNSVITACRGVAYDGSTSAGILATTYFGAGTSATITASDLSGNSEGVHVGYDVADVSVVTVHGCVLSGCTDYGVFSKAPSVDATGNWWGAASGPYHATSNPLGTGSPVSDYVLFDPWLGGNVAFSPDPEVINLADAPGYAGEVVLNYLGGGSGLVYGYSIDIVWDPAVITSVVVGLPDTGPFAIAPLVGSTAIPNGRRFDAALGNTSIGTSMAPLLKITYVANGTLDDAESPLTLTLNYFRDNANQPLSGFVGDDGRVIVDVVAPSVTAVSIVNDTVSPVTGSNDFVKDTDALTVTATVSDGGLLTASNIKADLSDLGGGVAVTPATYTAGLATWSIASAACAPANGALSVVVTVTDPSNNITTASDGITADNTLPTAVSGLVVTPGHNEVNAVWTNASGNDLNYYRTLLMTTVWGDYPDYATSAPSYPGSGALPAAWSGTGATTTLAYAADGSARDIVYVGAFVVDMALNYSPWDAGGRDRATNYWLGDTDPDDLPVSEPLGDGDVDALDVSELAASYGLVEGAGSFNDHCDVGPTDNWSGTGIPMPDNLVGFEDLMIFSLNYGDVAPLPLAQGSEFAQLEWLQTADGNWSLVLAEPCANLKALHLTAALPAGVKAELIPGSMLEQQAGAVFLRQIPGQELDVSLAILGTDAVVLGEGALFSVRLPAGALPGTPVIVARDRLNQPLELDFESTDAAELPTVYRLAGNFPNPFNPKTAISFDLPQSQFVKLEVFGTDGRRIATLLDQQMAAGHHSAVWTGRDDSGSPVASGVYFARIAAGPLQETHKMLLMK